MSQPASSDRPAEPHDASLDGLIAPLYERLRALARHRLRALPGEHSLNTTGLVHEAYLRLADSPARARIDRARFLGLASRVMRDVLVDHARARGAQKRGGSVQVSALEIDVAQSEVDLERVLELDEALKRLASIDPRQCRLVECRYFGGLSLEESASAVDVSLATAKRDLRLARAWLAANLGSVDA
jgi:RNA polymerase sigma factor (TIGR02999 family)